MEKDAVWLVSYPRSGNTWLRFLVANLLYPDEDVNYVSINKLVPDIHQSQHWDREGVLNPEVIKSHNIWDKSYEGSKIIYLYRDVRDVALSYYYYRQGVWNKEPFKGTLDEFLKEKFLPGERFGRWDEHVNFWFKQSSYPKSRLLFLRYETILSSPWFSVRRIASFLSNDIENQAVFKAIKKSSFEELEKIRARNGVDPKLKGLKGKSGGWRKSLTSKQKELLWGEFGKIMWRLGYEKL